MRRTSSTASGIGASRNHWGPRAQQRVARQDDSCTNQNRRLWPVRTLRQLPNPGSGWFNRDQCASYLIPQLVQRLDKTSNLVWFVERFQYDPHNAARGQAEPHNQVSEIVIFSQQDTVLGSGKAKNLLVGSSRSDVADAKNIETCCAHRSSEETRETFVGEKANHHSAANTDSRAR